MSTGGLPTRVLVVAGFLVALVIAGVVSYYASGAPDGLERVAEDQGFADRAEEHAASDSPLADYTASGVEDERASGAVAGVVGTTVVLALGGGLFLLLRRREPEPDAGPTREPV